MLAKMGFSYSEAIALPSWLFWAYVEGDGFERTLNSIASYEAMGLSAHGFEKNSHQQIKAKWQQQLSTPIRAIAQKIEPAKSPQVGMSIEERQALWG